MPIRTLAAGLALAISALAAAPAWAQSAPVRVRGVVTAVDGPAVAVASREGALVPITLPDGARLVAVARARLSDVKPGSYVGIAAMPQPDGTQLALEVLIFPEAMRGTGEGHRPWDLLPESTMTNATVAETVASVDGPVLQLAYKDGQKTVRVPAEAPVVTFVPATRADVKPGIRVMATVVRSESGATATSMVVGKDGVDPPM